MRTLRISDDLTLPVEVVTQTIAILAKRRAGKSYTMRRLAEQLVKAGQQIVLVDPKGDQWGIRSAADGKAPGLPIVILGGERADVPLEPGSGEVVAKLVVEERVSCLLDLSLFRKHEVATFMAAFLENLYRLKAKEAYRTPMMLVIDEADAIAPQKPQKGEERMLGAAEDIVRRGGQRGIGCVLVTQRSAVLNKNVLTQAQVMIALRTIAPQDLAAMNAWIDVHGTEEQKRTLMASLPSLPVGDAWIWSPGWPTVDGIFKRVHVLPIETFDSGATPKPGEKRTEPKTVADVDLDALRGQMAEVIDRAKENDPRELKKANAELRRQLAAKTPQPANAPSSRDREQIRREIRAEWEPLVNERDATIRELQSKLARIGKATETIAAELGKELPKLTNAPEPPPARRDVAIHRVAPAPRPAAQPNGDLTGPEQRILDAVAWMESIGVTEPEQTAVAFLAGYTIGGGAFNNPRGALRTKGLIDYRGGAIVLTDAGRTRANWPESDLTAEELQRRVLERLPGPEQKILRVLLEAYPMSVPNEALARRAGYEPGGGAFNNPRGRLRSLGLIDYPSKGMVAAEPLLFLEGGRR